jgi:AraC family transcriptional regulator of adaptative response / DNA-3-methyladenine glycosylase II
MAPKRPNVKFFPSAAAAHRAGFRACKRCRPDAAPGSPEWNTRADVVARAMRLIADGTVDREGVRGLSNRLGYSSRQLNRVLISELGAGPLALARAQRAQAARVLLETTDISVADTAFAVGFGSVRQFNDTVREVFALTPTELRTIRRGNKRVGAPGRITLRLAYRAPLAPTELFGFLALRAVPGVEAGDASTYRRTLRLPHGSAMIVLDPSDGHVRCTLRLDDLRDLSAAVARCRRLLDLDADPVAVDDHLGADMVLGSLVRATPGLRSPGTVDGNEIAIRTVIGQQVSVPGARTIAGRLAERFGEEVSNPVDGLTHRFPTVAALAEVEPSSLPMPAARGRTLTTLARALAGGEVVLDPGADRDEAGAGVEALPGIGPWTANIIRMRALGDPDIFLPTDLGTRRALVRLGLPGSPRTAAAHAHRWRPWRSYALHHLWAALGSHNRSPSSLEQR